MRSCWTCCNASRYQVLFPPCDFHSVQSSRPAAPEFGILSAVSAASETCQWGLGSAHSGCCNTIAVLTLMFAIILVSNSIVAAHRLMIRISALDCEKVVLIMEV